MVQAAAVVGAGGIAGTHLRSLRTLGVRIAGVCDIDEERAKQRADEFGGRAFTDVNQMLDSVSCDVVFLCTPPTARLETIRAVTSRKIPCFMEKPPAFDLDSAREIERLFRESDIVHTVGFMWRWSKGTDACKQILGGKKVAFVRSHYFFNAFFNSNLAPWFFDKSRSGGLVLDQAIHIFDLCRYLVGDVTQVQAFGNNVLRPPREDVTVEEAVVVNLRYQNDVIQSHTHSWAFKKGSGAIDLYTDELRISLDLGGTQNVTVWSGGGIVHEERFEENNPYLLETQGFLEAVRTGDRSVVRSPIEDAVKTLKLSIGTNQSLKTGQVVRL